MAYHIKRGESVRHMIRRIAREQVGEAVAALEHATTNRPKAVHTARKRVKKLRALLRLARGHASASELRVADERLRDAGRRLAAARDAAILVNTLDDVAGQSSDKVKASAFDDVRTALRAERRRAYARLRSDDETLVEVARELAAVGESVARWKVTGKSAAIARDGVERSYRRARDRFERACARPTDVRLHDWRKATKTLGYQLRLLEPVFEAGLHGARRELEHLADRLGDHQDLVVLRGAMSELDSARHANKVDTVDALVDRRRAELAKRVRELGGPLYAEQPKALGRRVEAYFGIWKQA